MSKFKDYFILFKSTFVISAFTVGGGYVIVPLLQKKFVEDLKWISEDEMLDLVAIAQTLPGVMAVNTSIIVGNKIYGMKGAFLACLGTVLPPFISLTLISIFYEWFKGNEHISVILNGMQSAVAAIIIYAAFSMAQGIMKNDKVMNSILFVIAFILAFVLKISVIYIIIGAIIFAIFMHFINKRVKS